VKDLCIYFSEFGTRFLQREACPPIICLVSSAVLVDLVKIAEMFLIIAVI